MQRVLLHLLVLVACLFVQRATADADSAIETATVLIATTIDGYVPTTAATAMPIPTWLNDDAPKPQTSPADPQSAVASEDNSDGTDSSSSHASATTVASWSLRICNDTTMDANPYFVLNLPARSGSYTWREARSVCPSYGASLATIDSARLHYAESIFKVCKEEAVWVGAWHNNGLLFIFMRQA
jgi:hypothetical protein